jgi:alkaline phosphatase D
VTNQILARRFWMLALLMPLTAIASAPASGQQADYSLYKELESERKIIGPLVGHVTDATASIWAYAGPRTTPVILEIAELESSEAPAEGDGQDDEKDAPRKPYRARLDATPDPEKHYEVQFEVTGLRPLTKYAFAVRMAEDDKVVEPGVFTTAPPAGKKSKFRLAVSSCFGGAYRREDGRTREVRGEYHADSWNLLMKEEPDFQLIIGDNVYADSTDYNHLWDAYTLERINNRPFAEAVRTIPTYAVWDDHDYGANNSDRTSEGKEHALRVFNEVFANPPRPGDDKTPGIFTTFNWGGVDIFLLDGRYHRAPNDAEDTPEKTFLGDEQLDWLIESLKASKAPFKLLVCGSTWQHSESDGWRNFDFDRRRLWKRLVENNINGVVYVSGDVHECDLPLHQPEVPRAYPMPEIISSGLGSHGEYDPMGFVVADFDLRLDDPVMTARVIDGTGLETNMRRVRASDLRVRKEEDGH